MDVLMKALGISIVSVLTVGLSGCVYFFSPSYADLYAEAEHLRYTGEYKAALEKYEQAFKTRPRSPVDTKVFDVSFPTLFKYRIAFCYAKLADEEEDASLYIKAEAVVTESYLTAIVPYERGGALYLWGYILFKQARYKEARAKFEELIETILQSRLYGVFFNETVHALRKTYLELGDKAAAQQAFIQIGEHIETSLQQKQHGFSGSFTDNALYTLGQAYLELSDEVAARRAFTQLERHIETTLQQSGYFDSDSEKILYDLGKIYLELSDEAAARRTFTQLKKYIETDLQRSGYFDSDSERTLYDLGKVYLELGDEATARRTFTQLKKHIETDLQQSEFLGYHSERILYDLGKVYLELGDEAATRQTYALLLEPMEADLLSRRILYDLGQAYLELGDEATAKRAFTQLEKQIKSVLQRGYPDVGDKALNDLGQAYLELGDKAAARRVFALLLEHYPTSSHKTEVKRLLGKR